MTDDTRQTTLPDNRSRKDSDMRSSQVYRALDLVSNRFTLCQTISQSARRVHIDGNPFTGTITVILKGIGDGVYRSA